MHRFDHCDHILDGRLRQNPMAQIKYVPGPTAGAPENFSDSSTDFPGWGKERGWV
jgi:hypothetical protein